MAITFLPPLLLFMMATVGASNPSPILVRLRGNFGTAPATVVVNARVERHADNRELCAVITGSDYETASCRPHIGEDAPLQVVFEPFRGLGPGEYVVVVEVVRVSDEGAQTRARGQLSFRILESPTGG